MLLAVLAVLAVVALVAGPPAAAHVVYGRASLAELVAGADVVARVRIQHGATAASPGGAGGGRPVLSAELLEVLKGEPGPGPVHFVQHGHGAARFEPGDEVLLCLQAIERSRELVALATDSDLRWVSLQESGAELMVDDGSRAAVVAAARGYVAAQSMPAPEEALAAWREVTLRLLRSPEKRLAESAVRDLVTRGDDLVTPDSLNAVEPVIGDPSVSIGVRLAVLAELERLGLIDGPRRWARLLASVEPPELRAVVRAAGAHPSAPVNRELIRLLEAGDEETAVAAAVSLGVPGNREAVAPLAKALREGKRPLQMATIRGLGLVGTPEALAVLEEAARGHPEASVRRRARAEVRRLERSHLS
jgi:hypothetical protein